ncbi:growth arrest and DNA damage-inducible protein GADD45 alpha-like [Pecten maximus]|uniref:growth arrest and DNA damage-inducible protein GADD45 alpha-like n=1 Tax=Pecten maximus TaxID=6579 RepID=UPI00145902B5|nr:growth arrest and DNA damage-inducible protein GADD45 alpha-like [Pecten maximus]
MTLPDNIECATEQSTRRPTDIGMALREVLVKALANNRLTSGVFSCVTLLNTQPEDVSVCVLPDVGPQMDVTINIQHKLLEAYCWENDIPVLRVDSGDKLSAILKSTAANNNASEMSDTSCVLVQNPVTSTKDDALINKFYNDVMASDIYPRPIIQLPV